MDLVARALREHSGLLGPQGLPIGLTATGPRFADARVIAAAEAVAAAIADHLSRS